MKKINKTPVFLAGLLFFLLNLTACPPQRPPKPDVPPNPPFFKDFPPEQGPWQVRVMSDNTAYQKLYVHGSEDVMIVATFARIDEPIDVDLTDPRNQRALAEIAMNNFCKGIEAQCLMDSADLAWIVGTSIKYIYVRFHAEKKGLSPLSGLIYYRFDKPFQTMYILLCDSRIYDNYETVFLNYLSRAEFRPQGFLNTQ